jgi:hypothetical protein
MIKAQNPKVLHKKINLGGEYVQLFKLMNLACAGWSTLIIPALIRSHRLNQFVSFLNTESKEWTSSSSINMLTGCVNQPMIEALDDEPLLHADNGFIREMLEGRDLVPKEIGLAQRKKHGEKWIRAFLPGWHCRLVGIETLFCLS